MLSAAEYNYIGTKTCVTVPQKGDLEIFVI